jgi:hypothetical protein
MLETVQASVNTNLEIELDAFEPPQTFLFQSALGALQAGNAHMNDGVAAREEPNEMCLVSEMT